MGVVNTHYCLLPIPEVIKKARMVDPRSNMYQRCVTSTRQPDFQEPNCDKKGSGVGARWKAGQGAKGCGAPPHPPPDRKKNLNLREERVQDESGHASNCTANKPPLSSCGQHSPSCDSRPSPTWGGNIVHEPGCPMNKPKNDSCHNPHCPIQRH